MQMIQIMHVLSALVTNNARAYYFRSLVNSYTERSAKYRYGATQESKEQSKPSFNKFCVSSSSAVR